MTSTTAKVMDTITLIALNNEAIRTKRNRALVDDIGDYLDPDGIHVVVFSMIHNDQEIRVELMMKMKGTMTPEAGWIDIPFDAFEALPLVTREIEEGT